MPARSAAVVTRAAGDVIPGAPARERADGRGLRRRAHHRLGGRLGGLRGHRSDARPNLGPWLRDERVPYDGLVAAAVDRLGRNVVVCLNTGYKMRDEKKMLVTYGHEGAWDLDDSADENRFTMEAWGAQMELRAIQRRNRDATVRTRAAGRPRGPHRPVPSQAAPRGRLAARHPRPLRPLLRTFLGLDRRRQRPARPEPGPDLVDDRQYEDRPRRPGPTRPRHRPERRRRLHRRRRQPPCSPATSPPATAYARSPNSSGSSSSPRASHSPWPSGTPPPTSPSNWPTTPSPYRRMRTPA